MKAMIATQYGPPHVLSLQEVDQPQPKAHELLIQVKATTVTAGDCEMRSFSLPFWIWLPLRLYMGLLRPRKKILGQELSGVVVGLGKEVKNFQLGDQVLAPTGMGLGAYGEYICLDSRGAISKKPPTLSHEEAACIPVGGLNALHFLKDTNIGPGKEVLVYGSTGSIGTVALQLVKAMGAELTAVCSTEKIDLVKSLGADHLVDYKTTRLKDLSTKYDLVFETVGKTSFADTLALVKPGGTLALGNPRLRDLLFGKMRAKRKGVRLVTSFADYKKEDLDHLLSYYEQGQIKSVIDKTYPLHDMIRAHEYVELGHKSGNVVITLDHK